MQANFGSGTCFSLRWMNSSNLQSWIELAKTAGPVLIGFGSMVALLGWWTSRTTQRYQNSKALIDTLQAALLVATDDLQYRKFLEDVRKEKLASMAFGVDVPTGEIGRLMDYYDKGFASTGEIRLAWDHRNSHNGPLTFRLGVWGRLFLGFGMVYALTCLIAFVGSVTLLYIMPWAAAWKFVPVPVVYLLLSLSTVFYFRGYLAAQALSEREKRHGAV